jgi:hypothetical protein
VDVGRCADYRERYSLGVDHNMALRARFSFIRGIRAGTFSPLLAATLAESTAARDQSILPASPNLSNSTWWSFSHTPACCQSLSLRQQVMPLPQPISGGSIFHCMPVLSTKMMPLNASRSGTLGRPPFGLASSGGKSDAMTSHSASDTMNLLIFPF